MKRNALAWVAIVLSTAALVSSSGVMRRMPAAPNVPAESQKTVRALSDAFVAVAESVKPSVVQIKVQHKVGSALRRQGPGRRMPFPVPPGGEINPKDLEEMLKKFFGPDFHKEKEQFGGRVAEGTGSGFVYDEKGHILTNHHVVDGADKITVTFNDGVEANATVVGTDPQSDVAVIKVDTTNYQALPRGESAKLKVGELVMAVGSPFDLSQSVTTGIISATERNDVHINEYESFIQTDAAINPGNSGGPLVNMEGQVIGVNSAIVSGSRGNDGIGFAIPIAQAAHVADRLIKTGKVTRARIGIALEVLTPALSKQFGIDPKTKGVLVGSVLAGSPAEKAGLKSGDVITEFNGSPVVSVPAFRLEVAASDVGKPFTLTYFRDGKENSTKVAPAPADQVVFDTERKEKDEPAPKDNAPAAPEKTEIKDFGLDVQPATPELLKQFGLPKDSQGVIVSAVKEGSPADLAGLQEGNIITKVVKDRKPQTVTSVKEFQAATAKSDELAVFVQSGDGPGRFVTLSKSSK